MKVVLFWFRRDLRLDDNAGLYQALQSGYPVLPLFIFDTTILDKLEDKKDRRVAFLYQQLQKINLQLKAYHSTLIIGHGTALQTLTDLVTQYNIHAVYTNVDYEPYATQRDNEVRDFLKSKNIPLNTFKDQVIFEKSEVIKDNGEPYTVFTAYAKKWKSLLQDGHLKSYLKLKHHNFAPLMWQSLASLSTFGFKMPDETDMPVTADLTVVKTYDQTRDLPSIAGTTHVGIHLRFGTVSIRQLVQKARQLNETFLNELIWREFFMMILWHYPQVVTTSFRKIYDNISWRNNEAEFEQWCAGRTGYPIVDAGIRELNATGFMHNRVRMITASFLCKHLLIDWRWGAAYFATKLLDYDLAANNGNWQWAAGCGCDAAPYFRIFSPKRQTERFDPDLAYIKQWVPEVHTAAYPAPMVDHDEARKRCLAVYKKALQP